MAARIEGELARALKVAGLPWRPRRGDECMDRLGIHWLVLTDGPNEEGAVQVHDGRQIEWRHVLGLCWFPRTGDLVAELIRHEPVALSSGAGRWSCQVGDNATAADTPVDAAGRALLALLSA